MLASLCSACAPPYWSFAGLPCGQRCWTPLPTHAAAARRDGFVTIQEYMQDIAEEDEYDDLSMDNVSEIADFEDWLGTIKASGQGGAGDGMGIGWHGDGGR